MGNFYYIGVGNFNFMIYCPYLEKGAGRLGNQMFQIAGTYGISLQNSTRPSFDDWSYRPYFSLPNEWFDGNGIDVCDYLNLPDTAKPYLQDISLWNEYSKQVKDIFKPSILASDIIEKESLFLKDLTGPVCSVHIRRGDNVTNDPNTINLLSMKYYIDALFALDGIGSVVVFSDDQEWCQKYLDADYYYLGTPRPKENGSHYFDNEPLDWIDMMIMAKCDFHVLSNSSYAWWAAYLSENLNPIYPSYWCGKKVIDMGFNPELLFPDAWRKIKC